MGTVSAGVLQQQELAHLLDLHIFPTINHHESDPPPPCLPASPGGDVGPLRVPHLHYDSRRPHPHHPSHSRTHLLPGARSRPWWTGSCRCCWPSRSLGPGSSFSVRWRKWRGTILQEG